MEFEEAKKRVGLVLKDFAPVPELTLQGMQCGSFKPERDEFPVPELILFAFEKFLGVEAEGPWEKTRWGIYALYKGVFLGFELRKFGLTVLVGKCEDSFVREALGKVKKAIKIVEDYLDVLPASRLGLDMSP